jgi:hypothetical protein
MTSPVTPAGIKLGIARGITYGMFGPPEDFVGLARDLGAGLVRAYLYWSQVEPEPGRFDWNVVDSLLAQVPPDEELWVTVCSSSLWATRQPTDFLPPSPPTDDTAYHRFVHALVSRCRGRVQYWQCENEPSNTGLLWAGTAGEYAAHLSTFHRAVRSADPGAAVVLGGCGYDVLSSPPDGAPRRFFDDVLAMAGEAFDLFSVHLYDDPLRIPDHIATVRAMMRSRCGERPVVVGEYGGPTLFELPELEAVLQQTMMAAFASDTGGLSTAELEASAADDTPERRAMKALYGAMPELPPALQMFMAGCPPELDARRDRISCREIVTRNVLALAAGVSRTVCWHLAPEVGGYEDPFTMMELMHGKLPLLAYVDGRLGRRRPAAGAFRALAARLDGAVAVAPVELGAPADVLAFAVERERRAPLAVVWKRGHAVTGEDVPPAQLRWPWSY